MAFCRSISVYIFGRPKIRIDVGVKVQKTVDIRMKVPLSLVGAYLISLSLLKVAKL